MHISEGAGKGQRGQGQPQAQGQTERKNVRFHAVFLLFCIFAARSARLSVVKAEPAGGIMISNGIWF